MQRYTLIISRYFSPGFKGGGPIQSLRNIIESTADDENQFRLLTGDRDLGDRTPYEGISKNTWIWGEGVSTYYKSPGILRYVQAFRSIAMSPPKTVYLNSLFDLGFSIVPLLLFLLSNLFGDHVRVVLAPRGELHEGALKFSARKKRLYLRLLKFLSIPSRISWHATTDLERDDIQKQFSPMQLNIVTIENLPRRKDKDQECSSPTKVFESIALQMVFVSRISRKKNLDFAIRSLKAVKSEVKFSIYGPIEDAKYWQECLHEIGKLDENVEVVYRGPLNHKDLEETLQSYALFYLPTLGENYGHSIAEAFQAGLAVLTSDQTPWRSLATLGIGADLPLDKMDAFSTFIDQFARLSPSQLIQMRKDILNYARKLSVNRAAVTSYQNLLFHP